MEQINISEREDKSIERHRGFFTVLEQHYCNSTLVHMLEATVEWVNAYHAAVPVSPCTVGE